MVKKEESPINHVYIQSDDGSGWIPALQLRLLDEGNIASVAVPVFKKGEQDMLQCGKYDKQRFERDNRKIKLSEYPNGVLPMANVDANGRLEDYKDMVELPFLHEVRTIFCRPTSFGNLGCRLTFLFVLFR